jgi:hypothetical protein
MRKLTIGLFGGLSLAVVCAVMPAQAQDEKLTVKDIMGKLHKGPNAPLGLLKKDLQAGNPDWPDIQKTTKDFVTLGTALTKLDPPKGDKTSWATLTKQYVETATTLDKAANDKDAKGALAAQDKLAKSCMTCHKAHRSD